MAESLEILAVVMKSGSDPGSLPYWMCDFGWIASSLQDSFLVGVSARPGHWSVVVVRGGERPEWVLSLTGGNWFETKENSIVNAKSKNGVENLSYNCRDQEPSRNRSGVGSKEGGWGKAKEEVPGISQAAEAILVGLVLSDAKCFLISIIVAMV